MRKKICVVTTTRADYGLLKETIKGIENSKKLELQLIVAGTHLCEEFGKTKDEIVNDKINIDKEIEFTLSSNSETGMCLSFALSIIGFSNALEELKPDVILLLGDRYEILSLACTATMRGVPIAHIHGGEITRGAIDENMRHAITKLACLHFVVCEEYRKRVIQMGEQRKNVINVGGLGIDAIKKVKIKERSAIENEYKYIKDRDFLIATMHPETYGNSMTGREQITELIEAVAELKDIITIFTYPNADSKGRDMIQKIEEARKSHSNIYAEKSLGMKNYFTLCKYSKGVIGNSSSGILEIPYLKVPVVNIGRRQEGRIQPNGIINCLNNKKAIQRAIKNIIDEGFAENLNRKGIVNPYGNGGAAKKIVAELEEDHNLSKNKVFFDFKINSLL